jgi:AraC-like DNA-binding protein
MADPLEQPPRFHFVSHLHLGADWRLPAHSHAEINEMVLVLSGEIETRIRGQTVHGVPGSVLVYPRGVLHQERAVGGPLHLLFVVWREHPSTHWDLTWPLISPDGRGRIQQIFEWLHELYPDAQGRDRQTLLSSLLHGALFEFARGRRALPDDPVTRVCHYIKRNFARDIDLNDLAKIAHQSKYHFARTFRKQTGLTPMQHLRQVRVEAAQALLATSPEPLRTVAPLVGLVDEFHLSRVFWSLTGQRPSTFRQQFLKLRNKSSKR